ncbi:MAG: Dabb family protein [Candidatus Delongbacteria bacterium]|nr:Dabb family protein [Candidatus Delongbacteria bacterium]MBN2835861.1 Dabb family protein [Candidatus Delongbacteria bacterium]
MFVHVVMWKLKKEDCISNSLKIKELLENLASKMDEVKDLEVGIDISNTEASYELVLYSVFKNRDNYEIYRDCDEHKKIVGFINSVTIDRKVVDYER